MRFSKLVTMIITAGALSASAATLEHSTSTVYLTRYDTITSCHPTVTHCPVIVTSFVEASTTVCPVTKTFTFTTSPAYIGASTGLSSSMAPQWTPGVSVDFSFSEPVPPYSTYVNSTAGSPAGTGSSGFPSPSYGSASNGSVTSPMPAYPTESVVPYTNSAAGSQMESILIAVVMSAGVLLFT